MDDFIESQNYNLTTDEENEYIFNINQQLNNYTNVLKKESEDLNSNKILTGSFICEFMLHLLLKKNKILVKNNTSLSQINKFAKDNKIIPTQCAEFLEIITKYRNQAAHDIDTSENFTKIFLKSFMYFISWFNTNYPSKNEFKIDECISIISSSDENDKDYTLFSVKELSTIQYDSPTTQEAKFKTKQQKTKKRFFEKSMNEILFENKTKQNNIDMEKEDFPSIPKKHSPIKFKDNLENNLILEELHKQNQMLEQILEIALTTLEITEDISESIKDIKNTLTNIQTHTEKLMKTATTEEEKDRIIQVHTDECVENIIKYNDYFLQDEQYKQEKIKLQDKFQYSWNKLSDKSKTFLITSKLMYNKLLTFDDTIDYSGICILITKALEIEIFNRFFTNFLSYLDSKYKKDYSIYPTPLLFQGKKPLFPESFTMGSIAFVLCYKKDRYATNEQNKNNKAKLMEYCNVAIFSKYEDEEIESMLTDYASSIEKIRKDYRNPSAHRNQIKRVDAKDCFDLVIDVEKLLKKMLDSFDR